MLVSVAGSQGLGKSVFIDHLSKRGIGVIERKTSRSILADWGVTLSEVNNNRPLTLSFQDEILTRKMADEAAASASGAVYVTERSYADLFAYAVVAVGKDNECSSWLDAYYQRCVAAQESLHTVMYLTPKGRLHGTIVHDGVRGVNTHYGKMVDLTMFHFTEQMCAQSGTHLLSCDAAGVDERYQLLLEHLEGERQLDLFLS